MMTIFIILLITTVIAVGILTVSKKRKLTLRPYDAVMIAVISALAGFTVYSAVGDQTNRSHTRVAEIQKELKADAKSTGEEESDENSVEEEDRSFVVEPEYQEIYTKLQQGSVGGAYQVAADMAAQGDMKAQILVSELFSKQMDAHNYDKSDEELDAQLNRLLEFQVELEELKRQIPENADLEAENNDGQKKSEDPAVQAYQKKMAEYEMATSEFDHIYVRRAINYLKAIRPDEDGKYGYYLQLARLEAAAGEEDHAREYLDEIFRGKDIREKRWLGPEFAQLSDVFHHVLTGQDSEKTFDRNVKYLISALTQNITLEDENFDLILKRYLRELYTGIDILKIRTSDYPDITVDLAYMRPEDLKSDMILVTDSGQKVTDYTLERKDGSGKASICIVLDVSGSMKGERLGSAKKAISQFARNSGEDNELSFVTFDSNGTVEMEPTTNKSGLIAKVMGVQAEGGTSICAGIDAGIRAIDASAEQKVMILLSDGVDEESLAAEEAARRAKASGIRIYTIGMKGADESLLTIISDQITGGSYASATKTRELDRVYRAIQLRLDNQYTLSYKVDPDSETDKKHPVKVEMRDQPVYDMDEYRIGLPQPDAAGKRRESYADYFHQHSGSLE